MKYIIEFEDVPYMSENGVNYYTCKSARWYKLGDTFINRLTPYNECLDRKAVENEVWEFVVKCLKMDGSDFYEIFNSCDVLCLTNLSYQEAKEKYEAWKAEKEEIRVGDEIDIDGEITVVTMVNKYGEILSVDCGGMTYYYHVESQLKRAKKTGRHFDEVEDLLKKIKEK